MLIESLLLLLFGRVNFQMLAGIGAAVVILVIITCVNFYLYIFVLKF